MRRIIITGCVVSCLLCPLITLASTYDQGNGSTMNADAGASFKPAHFGQGDTALTHYLDLPQDYRKKYEKKYKKKNKLLAIVYCQVIIDAEGRVSADDCVVNTNQGKSDDYLASVSHALGQAVFSPAMVANEPVKVSIDLSVIFLCVGGYCDPIATLNYGMNAKEIGHEYISPQEIIEGKNWFERMLASDVCREEDGGIRRECINAELDRLSIKVEVNELGETLDAELAVETIVDEDDVLNAAIREVKQSRFIPAYHEGGFVSVPTLQTAMFHSEGFESDGEYEEVVVIAKRQLRRFRHNPAIGEQALRRMQKTFQQMHRNTNFNMIYNIR